MRRGDGEPYIGESEAGSECNTRGDVTGPTVVFKNSNLIFHAAGSE